MSEPSVPNPNPRRKEYVAKKLKMESKRRDIIVETRWERHVAAYVEISKKGSIDKCM